MGYDRSVMSGHRIALHNIVGGDVGIVLMLGDVACYALDGASNGRRDVRHEKHHHRTCSYPRCHGCAGAQWSSATSRGTDLGHAEGVEPPPEIDEA